MAQLLVVAEVTHGGTWNGKSSEPSGSPMMAVSVTNADGIPLKGLTSSNFVVHFLPGDQINPVFLPVGAFIPQEAVPGVYVFSLSPNVMQSTGQKHIYSVSVSFSAKKPPSGKSLTASALHQGQTLTTLIGK